MITPTYSITPPIIQYFNRNLLCAPIIVQDSQYIKSFLDILEININSKKFKKFPSTLERLKKEHKKLMELYERAKIEEGNIQEKKKGKTGMPFYRIELSDQNDRKIQEGLKRKRLRNIFKRRKNHEIY